MRSEVRFRCERRRYAEGQGAIEYAIILSLIAVVVLGLLGAVGKRAAQDFCKVSNALAQGGPIYGVGRNDSGQLAQGSFGGPYQSGSAYTTPQEAINLCGGSIAAGTSQVGAIANDGRVWEWGLSDGYGEFGPNSPTPLGVNDATPVNIPLPSGHGAATTLVIGDDSSMLLMADGTVWGWGKNLYGQLGLGTQDGNPHTSVTQVTGLPAVASIGAGQFAYYALTSAGTLYAWGSNGSGQLGIGTFTSYPTSGGGAPPAGCTCAWTPVSMLAGVKSVWAAQASQTAYALMMNGTVAAWGYDGYGEAGDNQTGAWDNSPVIVQAVGCGGTLQNIVTLAPEFDSILALDSSGNVYAWGLNAANSPWAYGGMLGDGTTTNRACPVRPVGTSGSGFLTGATLIGASLYGSFAEIGGQMYGWGSDYWGELGLTSSAPGWNQTTPQAIASLSKNIVKITGGYGTLIALYPPTSN